MYYDRLQRVSLKLTNTELPTCTDTVLRANANLQERRCDCRHLPVRLAALRQVPRLHLPLPVRAPARLHRAVPVSHLCFALTPGWRFTVDHARAPSLSTSGSDVSPTTARHSGSDTSVPAAPRSLTTPRYVSPSADDSKHEIFMYPACLKMHPTTCRL
ncbi:hypothetical protein PLICRDRAFT_44910 [Plicaturopsis crispa FD-325 SS-3]|nr:hypothetical protein PLICRDRAFT_44910 [Plicaturopsis crispa FD-325 SS-3]